MFEAGVYCANVRCEEMVYLPTNLSEGVYTLPQPDLFCETDKLKDEEISKKAKELLSKIHASLENDKSFLALCTSLTWKAITKKLLN